MRKVLIKDFESTYHMIEGMKTMRTNLLFSKEDTKVVLVTSSIEREGKSSVAVGLSKSLAELKKKVLLIDADMRKTVLVSRLSGANNLKGLSHILSGQAEVKDIIASTDVTGLHLIIAGPTVLNATELLSGELFGKLVGGLREYYDYIIIDGAPIGLVVDSSLVGKHCDEAIFVVESGKVKYKFAQKAVSKIEASGCPVLGVVINKYDIKNGGEYYTKYYREY